MPRPIILKANRFRLVLELKQHFDIDLLDPIHLFLPEAPGGLPGKGGAAFNENQPKTDDGFVTYQVCVCVLVS